MKKTLAAMVIGSLIALGCQGAFPYNTSTGSFNAATSATGAYNAFTWIWFGYDDVQVSVQLLPVGATTASMRLCKDRRGISYLDVLNGTLSGSNYTATIARTNIPPDGLYFCEILGSTALTSGTTRVMATGRVIVQRSLYANAGAWTNPATGVWFLIPTNMVLLTNMVDNTTITFDGQLHSISPAAPDVVARAAIGTHTQETTTAHGGIVAATDPRVTLATTNATGGILTWASGMIGLTASAISNAMSGVYALAGHVHNWTAIVGLGSAATNETSYFLTPSQGSGLYDVLGAASAVSNWVLTVTNAAPDDTSWRGSTQTWNSVTGKVNAADVTNSLNLAISPSLTQTVAKAGTALQAVPTLQQVVTAGGTATGFGDISGTGRQVWGYQLDVANINAGAYGAFQHGYRGDGATMTIGNSAGAGQWGSVSLGMPNPPASMTIGDSAEGASQHGVSINGKMIISDGAMGAVQFGYVASGNVASNSGIGSIQLINAGNATMTGNASLGLGACTVSNSQAIVAGDGQASHGDGSITAGGGFYGNASGLTGLTAAQIAAAGGVTNAAVVPVTSYTASNPVFAISESVSAWTWTPVVSGVTCTPTFTSPGAGLAACGILRLANTNANSISWPTNVVWFANGTRATNAPTLSVYNRIVVDWFDTMLTLGVVSTNATVVP